MREFGIWAAFAAGLYVLQTSLLPIIAYHGVSPNLMLLLTVSFAFLRGTRQGGLMGFLTGLMQELSTGTFFGLCSFSQTLLGLFCGRFANRVFKEQFSLPVLTSLGATAFNYFILALLMVLLGYRFNLVGQLQFTLLPMLVYQLACAYPVHRVTYVLERRLREKK